MSDEGDSERTGLWRCSNCGTYTAEDVSLKPVCKRHTEQYPMQYVGTVELILKGERIGMSTGTRLGKQVIVGETNKTVEERPDVEDRIIQFSYVVGLNGLTKEQVDQFGEELSKEIAEHLIGDEKEKVMLLDWKDIRDLSAVEGYKLAALFKKAKEELEASSG